MKSSWRGALCSALSMGLLASPMAFSPASAEGTVDAQAGAGVVINEAYVNGGSRNAPFTHKFVELYNTTDTPVSLEGWSLQYRAAGGETAPNRITPLSGTIAPNGHFLVAGGSNGINGVALPTPDLSNTALNPAGAAGTIILSDQAAAVDPLAIGSVVGAPGVVDLLGYGESNTYETAAEEGPNGTTNPLSMNRANGVDTDNNRADFTALDAVTPTNAAGETASSEPDPEPEPPTSGEVIPINEIQGTGDATPYLGRTVTTRGVVTATYPTGGFDGYYIQTAGTGGDLGADHAASDGIFVYSPATVEHVAVGDFVEVTGLAGEYFTLSQISVPAGGMTKPADAAEAVKAASVAYPADDAAREALEGMLLHPTTGFTVSDNYALNQYGEITLAVGDAPLVQPTEIAPPGTAENAAVAADNAARRVKLDDGATTNFLRSAMNQPLPYLTPEQPVRVGSSATFTAPVIIDFRNSSWKFQPLTALTAANAAEVQPVAFEGTRPATPEDVGGNVKIASFNVLNYFTTTGDQLTGCTYYEDREGNPVTVSGGCDARGAANAENLERQEAKIVAAINGLGADVVSLEEIENSAKFGKDRDDALATLTAALNETAPGVWDYVRSPDELPAVENEDVIRTAFIYKKAAVEPVGQSVILDDNEAFSNARKPLAQSFNVVGGDDSTKFLVIANHFKSKGSGSGENADQGDGQGASNADRVEQATALVAFAEQLKSDAGTDKVFLAGDFNSYSAEDPMQVLYDAGYINQGARTDGYSYVFSGLVGSLDHILASPAADATVSGVDVWNVNAVESVALEYSRYNYNATNFYAPNQFRASDHDPVIVGLNLAPADATCVAPVKPERGPGADKPNRYGKAMAQYRKCLADARRG